VADCQVLVQEGYLCTGCGASCTVFTAANGSFSDGSPGAYQAKSDCSWIIAPTAAAQVTITFTSVSTESGYDFIWVYTCADVNCGPQTRNLIVQLSGTESGSYTSTSGYMLVVFKSDGGVNDDGFEASWTSVAMVCIMHMQSCIICTSTFCIACSDDCIDNHCRALHPHQQLQRLHVRPRL
jgi:hypothetical protein